MKKLILAILAVMLALGVGFAMPSKMTYGKALALETKSYCNATLDYDFSDNRVLVVLNKSATQNFKTYTAADFPEASRIEF